MDEGDVPSFDIFPNDMMSNWDCFEWWPVTGLTVRSTAPLLSQCSSTGSFTEKHSSPMKDRYQKAWLEASDRAMYLASVVFCATVLCFREDQLIAPPARMNTCYD